MRSGWRIFKFAPLCASPKKRFYPRGFSKPRWRYVVSYATSSSFVVCSTISIVHKPGFRRTIRG